MVVAVGLVAAENGTAQSPTLEERLAAIEAASLEPDGIRVVAGHISRKVGISVEVLRTEREGTGLGWGDLLIAHLVARETAVALEAIATELRSGQSWAAIARKHQLDLAALTASIQQSQDAIEQRSEDRVHKEGSAPLRSRGGAGGGKGGRRF
jgi:hypothetical protein